MILIHKTVQVSSIQLNKTPSACCTVCPSPQAKSLSVPTFVPFTHLHPLHSPFPMAITTLMFNTCMHAPGDQVKGTDPPTLSSTFQVSYNRSYLLLPRVTGSTKWSLTPHTPLPEGQFCVQLGHILLMLAIFTEPT